MVEDATVERGELINLVGWPLAFVVAAFMWAWAPAPEAAVNQSEFQQIEQFWTELPQLRRTENDQALLDQCQRNIGELIRLVKENQVALAPGPAVAPAVVQFPAAAGGGSYSIPPVPARRP